VIGGDAYTCPVRDAEAFGCQRLTVDRFVAWARRAATF
jgi:hypothetical protein